MHGRFQVRRPSSGTLLGVLALAVAMSGAAVAAIPGSDSTLTVCLSEGGAMRAVDEEAGVTCPAAQKTITLTTPGATVQRAQKADDADTLDGLDSTQFLGADAKARDADALDGLDSRLFARNVDIFKDSTDRNSESPKTMSVECPTGQLAIGAGADIGGFVRSGFSPNQTLNVALQEVQVHGNRARATAAEIRAISDTWDMEVAVACADIR